VPTGTVTFLLSDVVSSTELWQQFPADMPESIRVHEQIMRSVLTAAGGYEFGTAGDSFAVAFSTAAQAVEAAIEAQRALESHAWNDAQVRVRIGLHSGQADERDGRYFGAVVNRAARIESLAAPGQILVSEATCALARTTVSGVVSFRDLGEQQLKSFKNPERLFQVIADGLAADGGLVLGSSRDNLPNPPTSFVGRSRDIDSLSAAIAPGELVTVTGLAGLGKTRLAIEGARRSAAKFRDGIWWVDLSPLADAASVGVHAATALGITLQATMTTEASLVDALRRQHSLIVFDNCEHVINEAATLIAALRAGCPSLGLLATSREPLDLAGERNWPLSVMAVDTDGVALLLERAQAHDANLDVARWPNADLVDLCARLDGVPLAIEMAAARLRTLSPREIVERLDDRFRLLKSRDRQVTARHQTLLAALDWSYDLLEPGERLLLDRLSIFAGSFDARAAEQVCADDDLDEFDILDLVSSLLEKSLISQVDGSGSSRYYMLETVRAYCGAHLDDDETSRLKRSLTRFAVDVAAANEVLWLGDERQGFDRAFVAFSAEWDNFRAAIRWAVAERDSASCNAIFRALWIFAFETFRTEIGEWARLTLVLEPVPITAVGVAAVTSNDRTESLALLNSALTQVDEAVPSHEACLIYGVLHGMHMARDGDEELRLAERCVFHAPAMSTSRVASHRANLAMMLVGADPVTAAGHASFAQDYLDRSTNPWRAACVAPLAMYEAKLGRPEIGHQLCMRGVEMTSGTGLAWTLMSALACRARIALRYNVGDPRADLAHAIEVGRDSRAWYAVWLAMAESVVWLHAHEPRELAATIAGYMSKRHIWFRTVSDEPPVGWTQNLGTSMRRDELIDYVIDELAS